MILSSLSLSRESWIALEDLEYRAIFNEPVDINTYAFSMMEVALATIRGRPYRRREALCAGAGLGKSIEYAKIEVPNG